CETECLGDLNVDDQLELSRLLDGEVGGLCPLQDLVHEGGSAPDEEDDARPVRHQAPFIRELTKAVHGRQAAAGSQGGDPGPVSKCEDVIEGEECLSVTLLGSRKCGLEVLGSAYLESLKRPFQPLGRHLGVFPVDGMESVQGIPQHANPSKPWDDLLQELQPLPTDRFIVIAQPRYIPTGTRQAANQAEPYRVSGH